MKPPPGFREATDWERIHRNDLYSDGAGGLFVPNGWEKRHDAWKAEPEVERKSHGWWHVALHVAGWAFIFTALWDIATAMF